MSLWNDSELLELFSTDTPLIDVRSPKEFSEGALPGSVNLPIMDDEDRHLIGLTYKEHGQEAAIRLGHDRVSGAVKEARVNAWLSFIKEHPRAQVFCFRGGLRSQIACQWISEKGIVRTPIRGGYKRMRQFLLSWLTEASHDLVRLGGLTGSGKTHVLRKVRSFVDIEELGNHRGSSFGNRGPQPAQITFENHLARELLRFRNQKILVEDESVMLGSLTIPLPFFTQMKASPLVVLEVSPEKRIETIFHDYVREKDLAFFLAALKKIERKIGGLKAKHIQDDMMAAFAVEMKPEHHQRWITELLESYYDPYYQRDIEKNKHLILFRGDEQAVLNFLREKLHLG